MNTSSDAAEQIVKISLDGFQVIARISGQGAKNVAAMLVAIMKDNKKMSGKTKLKNMLKSGKEQKIFSIKNEDLKKFAKEAKKYGVLYTIIKDKKSKDRIVDIMAQVDDAAKINRILDGFQNSMFNEANIRSKVEKEEAKKQNPHLEGTVKNPQSKPSLKTQKTSPQGYSTKEKTSVKEKLNKAKEEVKIREKIRKTKILSKEKKGKVK